MIFVYSEIDLIFVVINAQRISPDIADDLEIAFHDGIWRPNSAFDLKIHMRQGVAFEISQDILPYCFTERIELPFQ